MQPRIHLVQIIIALSVLITASLIYASVSAQGTIINSLLPKESTQISSLEKLIAEVQDPAMKSSLEHKQDAIAHLASARATSAANPEPKPVDGCALRPTPDMSLFERERGIISEGAPLPQMKQLIVKNTWVDLVNGWWLEVYAGSTVGNPEQGIIVIAGEDPMLFGLYPTPEQSGSVEIISYAGARLTLKSESGKIYFFDIPARQFVPSAEDVVLPLPVLPTPEPTPDICAQ